ncbi:MAG: MFS transporter [Verrucomicrobiaceae bacterium]|nr:MFS transporter [Verrucomicrobiaceae bacterium]
MNEQETTSRTFRNELLRSVPAGVLDTLGSTFGMLVAVRVFEAGKLAKSTFLSATSGGLIASLFVVPLLLRTRSTVTKIAARVQFIAAAFFVLPALMPEKEAVFIIGSSMGLFFFALQVPLQTQIYRLNYPEETRGKLFALTATTRSFAAAVAGLAGGWLLGWKLHSYVWLLWAFAVASAVSGFWTYGLPAMPWQMPEGSQSRLLSSWRWVREDRDFRTLLISWMIMGIGNLVSWSLLVEFLANEKHGHSLPTETVVWITGVVPVVFRVVFTYPWGLLYDRVNFFAVRASLNVVFALASLFYYCGGGLPWWVAGMALFGIGNAGGNVTWSLWVTKLAPKHAVAEYMSVHSFLTGVRGIIAPYLAFAMIDCMSFPSIGIVCSIMVFSASGFIVARARGSDPRTSHRLVPGAAPPDEEWRERL